MMEPSRLGVPSPESRITRIDADFKSFSMYTLPLQRSGMSIEYMQSTVSRSSGAVCLQDAF